MTVSEQDYREVLQRLARIEEKLDAHTLREEALDRRTSRLETVTGRHGFVTAVISATAAGVVLMVKYLAAK